MLIGDNAAGSAWFHVLQKNCVLSWNSSNLKGAREDVIAQAGGQRRRSCGFEAGECGFSKL
jgi:hypothetical protein